MWREARKQERITKKLIIDHKKRAERRRENVAKNRLDPTSLLQIHGTKAKINIDPTTYQKVTSKLLPWQGDKNNMIDTFDIRTSLDSIPTDHDSNNSTIRHQSSGKNQSVSVVDIDASSSLKQKLNYERYRILIQDGIMEVAEERRLRLIKNDDYIKSTRPLLKTHSMLGDRSRQNLSQAKAAIGLNYRLLSSSVEKSGRDEVSQGGDTQPEVHDSHQASEEMRVSDLASSDIEVDDSIDIGSVSCQRVDEISKRFGLVTGSFKDLVDRDKQEEERIRKNKEEADYRTSSFNNIPRHERRHIHNRSFGDPHSLSQDDARSSPSSEKNELGDESRSSSSTSSSRSSCSSTQAARRHEDEESKDSISLQEQKNAKTQAGRNSRPRGRKKPDIVYGPEPAPKTSNLSNAPGKNSLNLGYSSSSDSSPVRQRSRSRSIPRRPPTDTFADSEKDKEIPEEGSPKSSPASPVKFNNKSDTNRSIDRSRSTSKDRSRRSRRRRRSSSSRRSRNRSRSSRELWLRRSRGRSRSNSRRRSCRESVSTHRRRHTMSSGRRTANSPPSSSSSSSSSPSSLSSSSPRSDTSKSGSDSSSRSGSESSRSSSSSGTPSSSSTSTLSHKSGRSVSKDTHPRGTEMNQDHSRRSRRRSPTPLAYRRHKRSSRSLARELRKLEKRSKRSRSRS